MKTTSKTEHIKELINQGLASLTQDLEKGKSHQLNAYIAAMARFHRYSFRNIMLITRQRPGAAQVAGFRAWKKLGRYVKPGETGIVIIAPVAMRKRAAQLAAGDDEEERLLGFKAAHVFDVTQTEGDPLPEPAAVTGDPRDYTLRLKDYIKAQDIALEYPNDLAGAEGASHGGRIAIRKGLAPAAEFSVLVHELAHEMLHWTGERAGLSKAVQETEAEAAAFIVSSAIGLETGTASSDYIQLYNGSPDILETSLDAVRKAASQIIAAIQPSGA